MSKQPSIKIGYKKVTANHDFRQSVDQYRVISVKNSILYSPMQFLTREQVQDLCECSAFEVTVVPMEDKR